MVSVIIPTYNRERTIKRAIFSVLDQSYSDLELIVVDDCSTDRTEEVVGSIVDTRMRYIKLEYNQGACAARNAGIQVAKGDYIAFQDSDDEWYPSKLERQLKVMADTGADVSFHKVCIHYKSEKKKEIYFPKSIGSRFVSHEEMCNRTLITTQSILGKRSVFLDHEFDPEVKKTQDYDWGIRASRNHSFYYFDEVLVKQYYQDDSISAQGMEIIKKTRQYYLKKYKDEFKNNPSFEIFQLRIIAKCKLFLEEDPLREYERIYKIRHTLFDLVPVVLCKAHLLKPMYCLKEIGKKIILYAFYSVEGMRRKTR